MLKDFYVWLQIILENQMPGYLDSLLLRGKFRCSQIEYGVAKLKLDDGLLK